MQIVKSDRRDDLKQLPETVTKALAISAPINENELYFKLKSISQYYKNNALDEEVNIVEVKTKQDGIKTTDPTETFATELANALCCYKQFNTRGGGQRLNRGKGNFGT